MSPVEAAIPYEKQAAIENNRTCGAACLAMAYRSFGREVPQIEIWTAIAKINRFGSLSSTTHLMAQDAVKRGLTAIAFQARHPLQVLRLCRDNGIRAILNHRPTRDSFSGHYSLLVDIDDKRVVLHDPSSGPARQLLHAELLELWQPAMLNSEIAGHFLVAIAGAGAPAVLACEFCHTPMPPRMECPRCKQSVGLRPGVALGCANNACIARMWNYLCCPSCDYTWSLSAEPGSGGNVEASTPQSEPKAADEETDPLDLTEAFAELDKFCAYILAVPAAAADPEIRKQIDFLTATKEQLVLAKAEGLAHLKAHLEGMAAMVQSAKDGEEAHRKKVEAMNQPLPALDGNALGHALLKNLGFKH